MVVTASKGATQAIGVPLVDDDALVRSALRTIVSSAADLEVLGEVADGADVPAAVAEHRPHVVLMDIRMPGTDGITATAAARAAAEPPEVVVMMTFGLDDYVFRALQAGASGFLLKDTPPTEILAAVRAVVRGDAILSPAVTRTLIGHYAAGAPGGRRSAAAEGLAALGDREREVALEVAVGLSNAEIAARLYMSEATVKAHVSRLLVKLGVGNRVQIALLVRDAQG